MADFDQNVASALEDDETFQGLLAQLRAAAASEVTVRDDTGCQKCGCKHIRMVKVPDYNLKLKIMAWLAERGVGRPQATQGGDDVEKITFIRTVNK